MKLDPIITSALENDVYKENMANIILKKYSDRMTRWSFKCRNANVKFTPEMIQEIRDQVTWYCDNVKYTENDIAWLKKSCPWLSNGYLAFLKYWRPDRNQIFINEDNIQGYNDCGLAIEAYGTWLDTSKYEIPILAIVSEVYYSFKYGVGAKDIEFQKRTIAKFEKFFDHQTWELMVDDEITSGESYCASVEGKQTKSMEYQKTHQYNIGNFAEFGLRRRYSKAMQDWLIKYCTEQKVPGFVGTSNMYLAKKYNCKSIGTQAHEFYMAYQGDPKIAKEYSNYYALKDWVDEYQTRNGTALTDTLGTDLFLKDFDLTFANLFSGVRHDSGDPIEWGDKMIAHYKKLGIDPTAKTLLFSDSLDFEKATKIYEYFNGKTKVSFGIGTYLSNDCGIEPLNIVMKMTECNGYPVCKLSNCNGKVMCKDDQYVDYLKRCIEWRLRYEK